MAHISAFIIAVFGLFLNLCAAVIVPARSCRPSLPVNWFIHQGKTLSLSSFSPDLQYKFHNATNRTNLAIQTVLDQIPDIDTISIVVAGPWGHVSDHHVGKLRFNETKDTRVVDGDSIYRIASISKVSHPKKHPSNASR